MWFLARQLGGWKWLSIFLVLGHFVGPFLILISRHPKRMPGLLAIGVSGCGGSDDDSDVVIKPTGSAPAQKAETKETPDEKPAANVASAGSVERSDEDSLFDRYQAAKAERGLDVGVDRETFDKQIAEQRKKIEQRLGRKVRFDVQIEGDKVRVVAKKKKK